jgi:hypothetical protein
MAQAQTEKKGSGGFKSSPGKVFGKLEKVFDDVWWVWGTVRFMPGVLFPRNMTIVREADGSLVIIHAVMLPDDAQKEIEALGPIKHVVKLGAFHGMDDRAYHERYKPTIWAPVGCDPIEGVTRKELVPGGDSPIAGATIFDFASSKTPETAMLVPRHGGVLLACDSVQNWETTTGCTKLGAMMARMMGFKGRACIGPGWRRQSEPKDGKGFAPEFGRLVEMEFKHALSAHGAPMKDTARDDLRAQMKRIYK